MNILLIDKSPLAQIGIRSFMETQYPHFNFSHATSSFDFAHITGYDVVMLGIRNEQVYYANLVVIKRILAKNPDARLLLYETEITKYDPVPLYLSAGITGYMSISVSVEEFLVGFNSVVNGIKYLAPEVMNWFISNSYKLTKSPNSQRKILTVNELDVAQKLISGKTITTIAKESNRKATTISTIKKKIFEKARVTNVLELRDALQ